MTPQELAARAKLYVDQGLERLASYEAQGAIHEAGKGDWVSLRRNLESAQADLETLTREG